MQGRGHRGRCPAPPPLGPSRRHSRLQHSPATVAWKLEGPRGSQLATRADSGLCCKERPNPLVPTALAGGIPETGQGRRHEDCGWPDAHGDVDSQALIDTVKGPQCTSGSAKPVQKPPSHCPWPTRTEPPRLLLVGDQDQTLSPPQADQADPAVAGGVAPRLFAQSLPVVRAEASPTASLSESSHKRGPVVQPPALLLDPHAPPPDIERPLPSHGGRAAGDSAYRLRSGRFSRSSGRLPAPRLPPRRGLAA